MSGLWSFLPSNDIACGSQPLVIEISLYMRVLKMNAKGRGSEILVQDWGYKGVLNTS